MKFSPTHKKNFLTEDLPPKKKKFKSNILFSVKGI